MAALRREEKSANQSKHSPPIKRPKTAGQTTTSLAKPHAQFNFRHKLLSLLVVGHTQSGKTYFVQQILKQVSCTFAW